jgi:hypothetical protein
MLWFCDKCESEQLMNGKKVDQDLEIHRLKKEIRRLKRYEKICNKIKLVRKLK